MTHAETDHVVDNRFQALGDKGLQDVAFDRQAQTGHRGDLSRPPGGDDADFFGADRAARGLHAGHATALDVDAGDFALLDQVHAACVRTARIAPGHRIVARGAAARVQQAAVNRKRAVS